MYNSKAPQADDLPSSKKLLVSTVIAIAMAVVILMTVIYPAEYGYDPTGAGRLLGLTEMGEIKTALAEEAAKDEQAPQKAPAKVEKVVAKPAPEKVQQVAKVAEQKQQQEKPKAPALKSVKRTFELNPGAGAEIKMTMDEGKKVQYQWIVENGHVNYDTHGDSIFTSYHGYGKGRAVKSDQGELVAAFYGNHGWFWRNRSSKRVTVTLTVTGEFEAIARVM